MKKVYVHPKCIEINCDVTLPISSSVSLESEEVDDVILNARTDEVKTESASNTENDASYEFKLLSRPSLILAHINSDVVHRIVKIIRKVKYNLSRYVS